MSYIEEKVAQSRLVAAVEAVEKAWTRVTLTAVLAMEPCLQYHRDNAVEARNNLETAITALRAAVEERGKV